MAKTTKKVLFNNGEGVDFSDFNKMQDLANVHFVDAMNNHRTKTISNPQAAGQTSGVVWAWGEGAAVIAGGVQQVSFISGLIGVNVASASPDRDQELLTYWLDPGDVPDKNRPSPGAGNERWDVLAVVLSPVVGDSENRDFKDAATGLLTSQNFNKRNGVEATFTWVQGTAAPVGTATLPATIPSQRLCAVLVKDGALIEPSLNELQDHRYPMGGFKMYSHAPFEVGLRNPGPSIILEYQVLGMRFVMLAGETVELYSKCPTIHYNHRIALLEVDSPTDPGPSPFAERLVRPNEETITTSANGVSVKYNHTSDAPLWANGYSAGVAARVDGAASEGVVWKGKAENSTGSVAGYTFNGILWEVFGE